MSKLIEQLKRHEGFKRNPYRCTAGKLTIGYGYNLDANPLNLSFPIINNLKREGISSVYALTLLDKHVGDITSKLTDKIPWFHFLSEERKGVLINMAFNLGIDGLLEFKKTLGCIERGWYEEASKAMLNSKWAGQVKNRAKELADQMRTGEYA